jgi:hypothetical protein
MQAVRLFPPCEADDGAGCDVSEHPERIRLASLCWYKTVVRIQDRSTMIIGGSRRGGWMNNTTTNNPTLKYYPPKNIHGANSTPIHLQFLVDTLNSNLFPIAFSLPDGRIFIAAKGCKGVVLACSRYALHHLPSQGPQFAPRPPVLAHRVPFQPNLWLKLTTLHTLTSPPTISKGQGK